MFNKKESRKVQVIKAAKEMIAAKRDMIAYSKKEISKKELDARKVKLALPL